MLFGALISKAWNGIAADRLHRWGIMPHKKGPHVPERTRTELREQAERLDKEGR